MFANCIINVAKVRIVRIQSEETVTKTKSFFTSGSYVANFLFCLH